MNYLIKNNKSISNLSARLGRFTGSEDGGDIIGNDNGKRGQLYWKGKKIIPLKQWIKMGGSISRDPDTQTAKEALQYFPDDYTPLIFPLGIPDGINKTS